MKIGKILRWVGVVAVTAFGVKKATRPIGPCSPELECRCSMVNANRAAIDEWRKSHPDTKLGDYDTWFKYLRDGYSQTT